MTLGMRQGLIRLHLKNYRNYEQLDFSSTTQPVVLTGVNGSGKTNLLEALSFLSPGRGLRSAKLTEVQTTFTKPQGSWALSATLSKEGDTTQVGTGGVVTATGRESRQVFLNGKEGLPQTRLTELVSVLWLTPAMDRLFLDGSSSRRRFFDRLVFSFDAAHATRMNRFELKMRERNRLLEEGSSHHPWLSALEKQMVQDAFDLIEARYVVLKRLQDAFLEGLGPFPTPILKLTGPLESYGALSASDFFPLYTQILEQGRAKDQAAGRTLIGPHVSDFEMIYQEKNRPAPGCSTGEQKALLVAIILGAARLKARHQDRITLVLLDEVVAHLDQHRRQALLSEILALPLQTWMTGTDETFFQDIKEHIQHFQVENGELKRV